jgi:hypothetical protein
MKRRSYFSEEFKSILRVRVNGDFLPKGFQGVLDISAAISITGFWSLENCPERLEISEREKEKGKRW